MINRLTLLALASLLTGCGGNIQFKELAQSCTIAATYDPIKHCLAEGIAFGDRNKAKRVEEFYDKHLRNINWGDMSYRVYKDDKSTLSVHALKRPLGFMIRFKIKLGD
jgi:uncharacterized protein YcfL